MKIGTKQIALVIVFLTIIGLVQACTGSNSPQMDSQSTEREELSASSALKVSSLTINPPEANPGVQIIATAKVTNNGSAKESYTPKIRIDDVTGGALPSFLYLKDVDIPAGATQLLSFVIPTDAPGKYEITWGELIGEFTVVEENKTDTGNSKAAIKSSAPDFSGVDVVTNQKISLSQFKGSVVLLNFVNYGCDPSVNNVVSKQLLAIRDLKKQWSDFVPVSVFCGCCPPEVLRDFAQENNLLWPWILDTDYSIIRNYVVYLRQYGFPTLILIDQEQYIREVAGYSDLSVLSAKLEQILSENN